jgi:hypothetical protein
MHFRCASTSGIHEHGNKSAASVEKSAITPAAFTRRHDHLTEQQQSV